MSKKRIFYVIIAFTAFWALNVSLFPTPDVAAEKITIKAISAWGKNHSGVKKDYLPYIEHANEMLQAKYPGEAEIKYIGGAETIPIPEQAEALPEFQAGIAVFDFSPMQTGLQGYYWDFPSLVNGQPVMNRGVFDSRIRPERKRVSLPETLRGQMRQRQRRLNEYPLKGHPIHWFDRQGQFARERILLAGDAAGADPLLGEGISGTGSRSPCGSGRTALG